MKKKKIESVDPADKPKRKTKKVTDASNPEKPRRKRSTPIKVEKPMDDVNKTSAPKVDWRDSFNPFKLSDYYTEDPEEINLISLLDLLSETDDESCDFELDEKISCDSDDSESDAWLNEIEARFDAVVDPILAEKVISGVS